MPHRRSRRKFIRATGAVIAGIGAAGCLGDGGGDDTDTPTDTRSSDGTDTDVSTDTPTQEPPATPAAPDEDLSDVEPVARDDVLFWWPFHEGTGDAMEARIDAAGESDGNDIEDSHARVADGSEIEWVEGEYINGSAVRSPEGDNYMLTSTYADFGSNMDGDFTLCVTFELETDGVLFGGRTFDSYNGLTIQMDGRAESRAGMYMRSDGFVSGENDYVFGSTPVVGQGRYRAVIVKETNDATNYRVYLNGEEDDTIVEDNNFAPENAIDLDEPFGFFTYNNQGNPQRGPDGVMDDFIIYDRALSEEEIQSDFERQPWDPEDVTVPPAPEPAPIGEPDYWWPLSEGAGDSIRDFAGETTATNMGASWVTGPYQGGAAIRGDGAEALVETTTLGDFGSNMDGDFSICFTMDVHDQGKFMGSRTEEIVEADPDERDDSYNSLVLQGSGSADGRPGMFLRADSNESIWDYVWGESNYVNGGLFRVAVVKETNDATNYRVYLNGEEDNTMVHPDGNQAVSENFIDFDHPWTLLAYNDQGEPEAHVTGALDDVVIYSEALSADQVQQDYDRQDWEPGDSPAGKEAQDDLGVVDPVGEPRFWWPMDEGEGDQVADNAGDADGTNQGASWVSGPYQGGAAMRGDGEQAYVETTTWGDFGSNMDGDFTICLTIDLQHSQGVFMGTRTEEIVEANPDERDDSLNGLVIQGDGGADGRPGMFLRADSNTSEWDYIWGETEYLWNDLMRVVIKKETNDAANYGVYVNGEEDNTFVNGNDVEPENFIDFDHPFTLLCYNGQGEKQRHADGVIDDVVVYDEALSEEDIQADYDRQHWA
jgi:hypothetical protein